MMIRRRRSARYVDLHVDVGGVVLPNPVMAASGTAGHGSELAGLVDLSRLGAVVTKSVCLEPWPGNPAPRVHETPSGMINSVGLQGPGIERWLREELPSLLSRGVRVIASIWGRSVEEYEEVSRRLCGSEVTAVEVNLSCPNLGRDHTMFAHDPHAAAEVMAAVSGALGGIPAWAKLSPNTDRLVDVAAAVGESGAAAVTLVNTLAGMIIDVQTRRPLLGGGGGGLSGPAIHPVAVRAVYDCRAALPELPIVGVGGVRTGADAVELIMAGADAVQVGTASFAEPDAALRVLEELEMWCDRHDVGTVSELQGVVHR